jgi:hypothetical protein
MTTVVTRGAASAQALGYASSSAAVNYVEDVFSTYLYTGNGSTQTITNGIDLSTKGGLTWIKSRTAANLHNLVDTNRGANLALDSSTTLANWNTASGGVTSFNSTGFSLGNFGSFNGSGSAFASWTFRKQPKFFDVVTYTGNGANRTIAHNLGAVPGFIIVKCTSTTSNWPTYHRSLSAGNNLTYLNLTNASTTSSNAWNNTAPTATEFSVGGTSPLTNSNGETYVAYLFAHDAGGFGLTGTDNVISCGSFTSDASGNADVNLGYEPQWYIKKNIGGTSNWIISDVMRGWSQSTWNILNANTSGAEAAIGSAAFPNSPTATGFIERGGAANATYIYIAIRRGPMKVPTDATKVFAPVNQVVSASNPVTTNFPVDLTIDAYQSNAGNNRVAIDRLRGSSATSAPVLNPNKTDAEANYGAGYNFANNTGYIDNFNSVGLNHIYWNFRRAPGFFDEVCYTGTGSGMTVTHGLGVIPELIIVKSRSAANVWPVRHAAFFGTNDTLQLESTDAKAGSGLFGSGTPTSTTFTLGSDSSTTGSGVTYVAYLFATCAGVSKVGSYTGTGTTQQINCGFTSGARFVLIKRTDSTGDWYVWDSARGIVAGNDPYLLLNSTAAEVTSTDYVDTYSAGFEISSTAPAAINANGGSFIFFAVS